MEQIRRKCGTLHLALSCLVDFSEQAAFFVSPARVCVSGTLLSTTYRNQQTVAAAASPFRPHGRVRLCNYKRSEIAKKIPRF